jgi:peptidoglycan/LPS O-acetylase OafA/YrhL
LSSFSDVAVVAAVMAWCVALGLASLPAFKEPASSLRRVSSIDGLRGLLALCVFLCHAYAWYGYTHGRGWRDSESPLFLHFGQSAVALFFMITAFLFVGRLLDARGSSIDWLRLYVARVLRLTPAYWLAMGLMFATVGVATINGIDGAGSGIVLRTWPDIFSAATVWLGFSMLGEPAINAYMNTPLIVSGVTWSLPFEWTFYCVLPLLALPLRVAMPAGALVVGLASVLWIAAWQGAPSPILALPFLGGVAAAFAVRVPAFTRFARRRSAGFLVIALLAMLVAFCPTYGLAPLLPLSLAFALMAAGNELFGLLSSRGARVLGAMSYSIYLLHGIVLYAVFMLLIGVKLASAMSPWQHWAIVIAVLPVLLSVAWVSHRWVELPSMRAVGPCVDALRRAIHWRRRGRLPVVAVVRSD